MVLGYALAIIGVHQATITIGPTHHLVPPLGKTSVPLSYYPE